MSAIRNNKVASLRGALLAAATLGAVWAIPASAEPVGQPYSLNGVWLADGDGYLTTRDGELPPLKPEYREAYLASRDAFVAGKDDALDLSLRCKPPGEPRLMIDPGVPFEIVESEKRILIGYQWNRLVRMIEMGDPRELIGPTYFGQNAGHWDGDGLVVDVQGLHENIRLDSSGLPHGENARLTERFSLVSPDEMVVRFRFDDPEVYTEPWEAEVRFHRQPDGTRIKEDICLTRLGISLQSSDAE